MDLPDCQEAAEQQGLAICVFGGHEITRHDRCTPEWCFACNPVSYDLKAFIREQINAGNLSFMAAVIRKHELSAEMPGVVIQEALF